MNNILYIGPYKDSNGYGYSSRRFIDCLSCNEDINLSIRPIFYNKSHTLYPLNTDQYIDYEQNSSKFYDAVIQHGFPDFFVYNKNFGKNIGLCQIETKNIQRSGWKDKLNLMDEIWVGSIFAKDSIVDAGCRSRIKVIPEPYDLSKYNNDNLQPFFDIKDDKKPFIFYTIGQYTEKKNIKSIILAFMLEFNKNDNVRLFIKTGDYNIDSRELENIIKYDIHQIKMISRKFDIPDIDVMTGVLKDIDILRLHKSGDCYINCVKADDGGSCAIESKLCNKIVITTKNIGSNSYFNTTNALMVNSSDAYVYSNDISNYGIFTINELWVEPDVDSLRKCMREAYFMNESKKELLNKNFSKQIFDKHSISKVLI